MSKLREDEEYAVRLLAQELGLDDLQWTPGEDPPDAYIQLKGQRIAVEVTQLEQGVPSGNGRTESRKSQDESVFRIAERLNDELSDVVPAGVTVGLHLEAPIPNIRKFQAKLSRELSRLIPLYSGRDVETSIQIDDVSVSVHFARGERPSGKKIVGIVSNAATSPRIDDNLYYMISTALERKHEIYSKIKAREPVWLVMLNLRYPIGDIDAMRRMYNSLGMKHAFQRVYLVQFDGKVAQLS